ncbi:hypothetical protein MJO28_015262 [Puccinia striiformis f. sp. tritici]|uniref:Uncharacterized protein n=1 Tax=Puccinia striiformis f. sp. tritici TaxID=168172 RepID=A0ACC0DSE7_9BASI|nr:hypothetical protein MJO28_015262 [Puccinia striiformis f. sp. tritici]
MGDDVIVWWYIVRVLLGSERIQPEWATEKRTEVPVVSFACYLCKKQDVEAILIISNLIFLHKQMTQI